jgi:hypothetical protein
MSLPELANTGAIGLTGFSGCTAFGGGGGDSVAAAAETYAPFAVDL